MVSGRLKSFGLIAAALALGVIAMPAQAQFRIGGGSRNRNAEESEQDKCTGSKRSTGSRIAGGILGSIAGSAAGNVGGLLTYVPVAAFTDQITASIACRLDENEQKQAADATVEATRSAEEGGSVEVGQMAAWTSETRENVSGTSTVTASDSEVDANGLQCLRVTDVVIVEGEETRAEKRMCRRPPAVRYTIAA
jgi:surface antigen